MSLHPSCTGVTHAPNILAVKSPLAYRILLFWCKGPVQQLAELLPSQLCRAAVLEGRQSVREGMQPNLFQLARARESLLRACLATSQGTDPNAPIINESATGVDLFR